MNKKKKRSPVLPPIHTVQRQKVVLDSDLARLYGVQPKRLNEAVRRNRARFPDDFCFVLTAKEFEGLSAPLAAGSREDTGVLRSQIATIETDGRGRHSKYLPRVFTEHGALMAANILRSEKAVEMSLYLVRAFVQMRDAILANVGILKRLAEIDRKLIEHDSVLREVVEHLQPLLNAPEIDEESKPKIGFHRGNR
jgi:phage regulator Rha-like protein